MKFPFRERISGGLALVEHHARVELRFCRPTHGHTVRDEYTALLAADHRVAAALLAFVGKMGGLWPDLPMTEFATVGTITIYSRSERGQRAFYSLQIAPEQRIVTVWCFVSDADDDTVALERIRQRVADSGKGRGDQ